MPPPLCELKLKRALILNFATIDTYKNIALIVTYRYLHEFKLKRALINYGAI